MIAAMPASSARAQKRLRWMLFSALAMGALSLTAGSGTLAYFTTQVQSNNNTFTAGNLRFNIQDTLRTTGEYPALGSSLSVATMSPGQVVYAPIQLNNTGNLAAKYGIKYTTTTVLASNVTGGAISGTTSTLVDSGRTATNGLYFDSPTFGLAGLVGDYLLITAGPNAGQSSPIAGATGNTLTVTPAFSGLVDAATVYRVVNFAGAISAGTATTLSSAGTPWKVNQWAGYTVTASVGGSQVVVSNTTSTLTVAGPGFTAGPSGTYTISPSPLAPALTLGIKGKGASGTACNATTYGDGTSFADVVRTASDPTPTVGLMVAAGETVVDVTTAGRLMTATTGVDELCMRVSWPDRGDPLTLVGGDNAYNGAKAGAFSSSIDFVFDGLSQ